MRAIVLILLQAVSCMMFSCAASHAQAQAHSGLVDVITTISSQVPIAPQKFQDLLRSATKKKGGAAIHIGDDPQGIFLTSDEMARFGALSVFASDIHSMAISPGETFVLAADAHGGLGYLDLKTLQRPFVVMLRKDLAPADMAALERKQRTVQWYTVHGWDPPDTLNRALFMGLGLADGVILQHFPIWPDMLWSYAAKSRDCIVHVKRVSQTAELSSVCRRGGEPVLTVIATGEIATMSVEPGGDAIAFVEHDDVAVRNMDGSAVLSVPAKGDFVSLRWLDSRYILLYGDEDPVSLVDVSSKSASPLNLCKLAGKDDSLHVLSVKIGHDDGSVRIVDSGGAQYDWVASNPYVVCPRQTTK